MVNNELKKEDPMIKWKRILQIGILFHLMVGAFIPFSAWSLNFEIAGAMNARIMDMF